MPRIALLYTHHRRCGPHYYRRALNALGHEIISLGPWRENEPFGTRGRRPTFEIDSPNGTRFDWIHITNRIPGKIDAVFVIDGGEGLELAHVPTHTPLVHISTEGSNMGWSRGITPHRYAEIMCNGADSEVTWLPKAFDPTDNGPLLRHAQCDYDIVQVASARPSRKHVWEKMREHAGGSLTMFFGEVWGGLYYDIYRRARCTYVCSGLDFVTTRVFEAMSNGCVVIADRTPAMQQLFEAGVHYIPYNAIKHKPDGEYMPDYEELTDIVTELALSEEKWQRISSAALEAVQRHTYRDRMLRVLGDIGFGSTV